ncbi:hypothetical protein [Solirubrobacter soli]|uniref:hypothetical protein n=1 Tax=Solirubrobacter soli TaxID=363832 RepID=UPI000413E09F|nr:hypothetical protein [Solirubrobacter soli]
MLLNRLATTDTYRIEVAFEVREDEDDLVFRVYVLDSLGDLVGGSRSCFGGATAKAPATQHVGGTIVFRDGQPPVGPRQTTDAVDRYLKDIDELITRRGLDAIRRRMTEVSPTPAIADRLDTLPRTFVVPDDARDFIRRHL